MLASGYYVSISTTFLFFGEEMYNIFVQILFYIKAISLRERRRPVKRM